MNMIDCLSFLLFIAFIVFYTAKLIILKRRHNIEANMLGKSGKSKVIHVTEVIVRATTLVWSTVWFLESIFNKAIGVIFKDLFVNQFVAYFGILAIAGGLFLFAAAMVTMRTSWRVGIDKQTKTQLVTGGIYRYSRNPAFVGLNMMIAGLFLVYPNLLTLVVLAANLLAIHRLILEEENHLKDAFQQEYLVYISRTPRYLSVYPAVLVKQRNSTIDKQ